MAGIPNPLVNPANPGSWSSDPTVNAQGGAAAQYSNSSATTAASTETVTLTTSGTIRNKYYATLTLANPLNAAIETKINVTGITPTGYRGTDLMITGISDTFPYSVTYEVPSALGSQTVAGTVSVAGTRFNTGDYGMVKTGRTALMTDRTQNNVESFFQDSQSTSLEERKNELFAGLNPNLPFPLAILEAVAKSLLRNGYDLVIGVINTAVQAADAVADVIGAVSGWIGEAIDEAGKIVGDIATAIVDTAGNAVEDFIDMMEWVFSGGLAADFVSLLTGHKTINQLGKKAEEVVTTTYQTEFRADTYDGFFAEPRILPAWLGQLSDDVCFPQVFIGGTTNATPAGSMIGRIVMIPVTVSIDREYTCLKFGMLTSAISGMTSFNVAVYDINEETGAARKVIDLGNVKSQLTATRELQTITLPTPIKVYKGEQYYIAILQLGGTAGALSYATSTVMPNAMNTGVFPRKVGMYYNPGTVAAFPSDIDDAQLSGSYWFWGALGTPTPNLVPTTVYFADSFARSDATNLGTLWTNRNGSGLRIASQKAIANSSSGTSISTYSSKTNYLIQTAQAQLQGTFNPPYGTRAMILTLRGDGLGKFIYFRVINRRQGGTFGDVYYEEAQIYTASSYSGLGSTFAGGTARSSMYQFNWGLNYLPDTTGTIWKFTANANVYKGYKNNVEVCSWTDTGFAFTGSGAGNAKFREVGIGASYDGGVSSSIDNWSVFDSSA
jgi:hypothetical protein